MTKFILCRVSGMDIDNPDKDYMLPKGTPSDIRYPYEERIITLSSLEELLSLMDKYKTELIIQKGAKYNNHPGAYYIKIYDDYVE